MAFKLDFDKLCDPEWQARHRAEEAARQAEQEAKDKVLRSNLDTCLDAYETLPENERKFIGSCRYAMNTWKPLSEKQEKWLADIAKRLRG